MRRQGLPGRVPGPGSSGTVLPLDPGPGRWLPVAGAARGSHPLISAAVAGGLGAEPPGSYGVWGEAPGQERGGAKPGLIDLPGGQAAVRDDGRAVRPGNGGHNPPRVSSTMAMRASGLWNPYATLVSSRTWVLVASLRALLKP